MQKKLTEQTAENAIGTITTKTNINRKMFQFISVKTNMNMSRVGRTTCQMHEITRTGADRPSDSSDYGNDTPAMLQITRQHKTH